MNDDGIKSAHALKFETEGKLEKRSGAGNLLSPAAQLEMFRYLISKQPIYCDCKEDCDKIVDYAPPLMSRDEALAWLKGIADTEAK